MREKRARSPAFEEDLPSLKGCASVFLTLPERMVAVRGCGYTSESTQVFCLTCFMLSQFSLSPKVFVCFIPVN